jgi:hypothetical protein
MVPRVRGCERVRGCACVTVAGIASLSLEYESTSKPLQKKNDVENVYLSRLRNYMKKDS